MATILVEYNTEEQHCVVHFCGQKDSIQRIFIKKCFQFTVGSVCREKRFTDYVVNLMVNGRGWHRIHESKFCFVDIREKLINVRQSIGNI
jgi:hypothetical protein